MYGPVPADCDVFYRYATSHPVNRSAVWSVMCHVVLFSSEISPLMSPSDFGGENTTALFPIKPLSASLSLAWQKQKLFVLLGIAVCVCVCVHECVCLSPPLFLSLPGLCSSVMLSLILLSRCVHLIKYFLLPNYSQRSRWRLQNSHSDPLAWSHYWHSMPLQLFFARMRL